MTTTYSGNDMIPTITLYKNHKDSIGTWSIGQFDEHTILIRYCRITGGAIQTKTETVERGLAGRTLQEQVKSRIDSRINAQLDKGYVKSLDEARFAPTNSMGFMQPMLAARFDKLPQQYLARALRYGLYQPKLNGHRCLIAYNKSKSEWFAYSRKGKLIPAVKHIIEAVTAIDYPIDVDWVFDGELYIHGMPLQQIASLVKREQPGTRNVNFYCYDLAMPRPFSTRYGHLVNVSSCIEKPSPFKLVKSTFASGLEPQVYFEKCRAAGFEGAMLRTSFPTDVYEAGRRSRSLIKIKEFDDDEFKVIGIEQSSDGWAILVCQAGTDCFKVSAPGTIEEKHQIWENRDAYIGKMVTVSYAELTVDGIPFHPVALQFREDL